MTTEHARHQSFAAFAAGARLRFGAPLRTRTRLAAIHGRRRVEAVDLLDLRTGATERVACDLVVFTADWVPDHELAVLGGLELDPGTRGPAVDALGHTSRPGVWAAGNLLRGAETADACALEGRALAAAILAGDPWPATVPIVADDPLDWVLPNRLLASSGPAFPGPESSGPATSSGPAFLGPESSGPAASAGPASGRPEAPPTFLLRAREPLADVRIAVGQDGRTLDAVRLPRVMPGRSVRMPGGWTVAVDPAGGPVTLRIRRARRRA